MNNKVTVLLLVLWALAVVTVVHGAAAATVYEEESIVGGDGGGGRCNSTAECNGHGHCAGSTTADLQLQDSLLNSNATGVCHCDARYAGKWCEHKRKSKLEAFLLSILIGTTGADRFYLGFIGLGVAKLLLNVLACVPACIGSCLGTCCGLARTEYVGIGDDYGEGLTCSSLLSIGGSCLACCMSLGSVAWWLTDWILILKGKRAGGLRRLQPVR